MGRGELGLGWGGVELGLYPGVPRQEGRAKPTESTQVIPSCVTGPPRPGGTSPTWVSGAHRASPASPSCQLSCPPWPRPHTLTSVSFTHHLCLTLALRTPLGVTSVITAANVSSTSPAEFRVRRLRLTYLLGSPHSSPLYSPLPSAQDHSNLQLGFAACRGGTKDSPA